MELSTLQLIRSEDLTITLSSVLLTNPKELRAVQDRQKSSSVHEDILYRTKVNRGVWIMSVIGVR